MRSARVVGEVEGGARVEARREARVLVAQHLAHLALVASEDDGNVLTSLSRDLLDDCVGHLQ